MRKVQFRDWVFEVDSDLTRQTYAKRSSGGTEGCPCNDCKNYRQQKDVAFPGEALELFENVGIDSTKECETFTLEKIPSGLYRYSGWFHFAGKIISGEDCVKPIIDDKTFQIDLSNINENFKIGFTRDNALSFFDDSIELVQVEFETRLPWVIQEQSELD